LLGRPIPELKQEGVSIAFQNADMNGGVPANSQLTPHLGSMGRTLVLISPRKRRFAEYLSVEAASWTVSHVQVPLLYSLAADAAEIGRACGAVFPHGPL